MPETILALDPGIGRTGYAVMQYDKSKMIPLTYGCIETKSKTPTEQRLKIIYDFLSQTIKKYKPTAMVLEQVFFNTNQTTAITVGQAQGAMLLAAAESNLTVSFVTPSQIKQTLTGYGSAQKQQVEKMVMVLLGLTEKIKLDDTADALACGITYFSTNKLLK
ncbi:MAG: crossover junction endodeoxyribonuclease RuvC [Patescibacteria group bacterium]|jgi:crossover junction endodeoxyribonuclease RuvC